MNHFTWPCTANIPWSGPPPLIHVVPWSCEKRRFMVGTWLPASPVLTPAPGWYQWLPLILDSKTTQYLISRCVLGFYAGSLQGSRYEAVEVCDKYPCEIISVFAPGTFHGGLGDAFRQTTRSFPPSRGGSCELLHGFADRQWPACGRSKVHAPQAPGNLALAVWVISQLVAERFPVK